LRQRPAAGFSISAEKVWDRSPFRKDLIPRGMLGDGQRVLGVSGGALRVWRIQQR
jgi:hypothetical protein